MRRPLEGRVIAVAGAAGSLGPHVCQRLADDGATLALAERSPELCESLAVDLGLDDDRLDVHARDLLDAGATQGWADRVVERFGRVDCLAHLVGGWRGGDPLATAPAEDWDFLEGLLVRTVQHTTRAFHRALSESGRGRFVLVSAKQALTPTDANAAYASAKAAAEAWTWALADGFGAARNGATANVVAVNALVTPQMRADAPEKEFRTFTDVGDVAEAIAFVCSEAAAKMNGQRLALHG